MFENHCVVAQSMNKDKYKNNIVNVDSCGMWKYFSHTFHNSIHGLIFILDSKQLKSKTNRVLNLYFPLIRCR